MFAFSKAGHGADAIYCCTGRLEDPVQEIAVYDRNRKPSNWMDLIQPAQYAVFVSNVETGAEMTVDGGYPSPQDLRRCLIFDSRTEAEQFCKQKIEQMPDLRCDLFDSHGRANPPVAIFVSPLHQSKLDSPEKARRMMRWGVVGVAASIPLFAVALVRRGEWWLAAFFGVQVALFGLRLLQWGFGLKEELSSRARQSTLRAEHNAEMGSSGRTR